MTERNLAIRLSVMDGGRVKAELKEIGESGEKSLQKIELAGQPASKSLLALNAAANDVRGTATGLAHEIGPLGSAMIALGPAGIVAGAALAVLTLGVKKSIEQAMEAEQAHNRLQAVLRATGDASGLTAREISEFADQMEASTLVTAEQVMDAAAVLATFRTVAGESFTRALSLAQDLSSVFGKDLHASVTALGRALEDPVNGLTALRRAGIEFTSGQKEMLKSLIDTGQAAEAQKIILDKLEGKMGGTAAAETVGLTGASHSVAIGWKNMLEAIGQTSVVSGGAEVSLHALSSVLESITGLFKTTPISVQVAGANKQMAEAQAVLERLQNYNPRVMTDMTPLIDKQKEKIAELRTEIDNLTLASQKEVEAGAAEKAKAAEGREAAAKDQRVELLADQRKKLDEAIAKLVDDPAEKINKINDELIKTKQRLEALRAKDGGNNANVDAAIGQAEELARRQIGAVQKPINEAARKAAEANQKVMDDLQRQLLAIDDKRKVFIDQAVGRLSDQANDADRARTRDLAAKLFDQSEAQKQLDQLLKEGQQVTDSTRTATEAYADQIEHLKELLDAGAISQAVYNRALATADKDLLKSSKDARDGALRAFDAYREKAEDTASSVEGFLTDTMRSTDDAITKLVTSGGQSLESLGDLATSMLEDITRMLVQKNITAPLYSAIGESVSSGGFFSSLLSSFFHEGGVAGDLVPSRHVPSIVFANAPRYHGGGFAGLGSDEVPAILQRGETVLPKGARLGGAGSKMEFNFSVKVDGQAAGNPQIAAQSGRAFALAAKGAIIEIIQDQQRPGGSLYRG